MSSHKQCTSALLLPFASSPFFCPTKLRSITQMRLCNTPSSFVPQPLVVHPTLKIKNSARPLFILHRSSPVASCRRNSSSPTFSQLAVGSRAQLRKHSVELRVSSFFSNAGSRLFSLFFFGLALVYGY